MEGLRARAPAKLNLGLRVVGRRPDGYHELESVFVPLDLADEIELAVSRAARPAVALRLTGACTGVPAGEENLAARAALGFLEAARLRRTVEVRVEKRIPAAAGLGGGSSDAGAVLRLLAARFPEALAPGALGALALRLGADVPYFLDPKPALVSGIGERIEALPPLPALLVLLVHPGPPAPATAEVYRAFDALNPPEAPQGEGLREPLAGVAAGPADPDFPGALRRLVANDLEPAAVRLYPLLARLRERLRSLGPLAVGMSGSGPTLFAVFPDAAAAASVLRRSGFAPPHWARVARTLESREQSR